MWEIQKKKNKLIKNVILVSRTVFFFISLPTVQLSFLFNLACLGLCVPCQKLSIQAGEELRHLQTWQHTLSNYPLKHTCLCRLNGIEWRTRRLKRLRAKRFNFFTVFVHSILSVFVMRQFEWCQIIDRRWWGNDKKNCVNMWVQQSSRHDRVMHCLHHQSKVSLSAVFGLLFIFFVCC